MIIELIKRFNKLFLVDESVPEDSLGDNYFGVKSFLLDELKEVLESVRSTPYSRLQETLDDLLAEIEAERKK